MPTGAWLKRRCDECEAVKTSARISLDAWVTDVLVETSHGRGGAGRVGSVQDLAEHASIDASDIARFLPFAFLAPDIVEKILDGRQPIELNVERLKKVGPIPADWNAQRRLLGFAE